MAALQAGASPEASASAQEARGVDSQRQRCWLPHVEGRSHARTVQIQT